jgi:antitoxin (DNA-binding transcriptional repressor) of toxin-antitoxin stability system
MKIMSVGEFKTHFSQALKTVQAGEEIGISYGKNKEVVACLVPKVTEKQRKRKIGILEGKGKVSFGANFKISSEEFLGL